MIEEEVHPICQFEVVVFFDKLIIVQQPAIGIINTGIQYREEETNKNQVVEERFIILLFLFLLSVELYYKKILRERKAAANDIKKGRTQKEKPTHGQKKGISE